MKLPKSIKIGGCEYAVILDPKIAASEDRFGKLNFMSCKILIAADATPDKQCETLFHEMIHGISNHLHLGIKEQLTQQLAHSLYQVLKDSKII